MDRIISQEDINVLLQSNQLIYCKLEILNKDLKILDSLEGKLIDDNISISSDSEIRRTYTCNMFVSDSSFQIDSDTYIWFDKLIRPYIGIYSEYSNKVVWYLLGTFLYTNTNYNYNSTTHTLSLTCVDMMCLLNDERNGQIKGYNRKILAGSDAREVIIEFLKESNISNYFIEFNINNKHQPTFEIPYDQTFSIGESIYSVIRSLIDLYVGNQIYFDINGIFRIEPIPSSENENVTLSNDLLSQFVIDEQFSTTFSKIYNKVQVWGKLFEPEFYSSDVSMNDNVYIANIMKQVLDKDTYKWIDYSNYEHGDLIGLKVPNTNLKNQQINLNNLGNRPIELDDKPLPDRYLTGNEVYVFRYREDSITTGAFVFQGSYQAFGEAYLTNNQDDDSESAYYIANTNLAIEELGEVCKVCDGTEYGNIYTNKLAIDRAKYELYNNMQFQETLNLTTLFIPWLDVNQLITYKSKSTNKLYTYKIISISCDCSKMQMSLTLVRYYPMCINVETRNE